MIRDLFTYRGGEGYWAWILHRATGIGILLFLLTHIADTLLVFWPDLFDAVMRIYHATPFRIGEIMLVGIVTFHAVNGIRVTLIDFWADSTQRRRELFYATLAVFAILFIPALILMVQAIIQ